MFHTERAFVEKAQADIVWLCKAYASAPANCSSRLGGVNAEADIALSTQIDIESHNVLQSISAGARSIKARGIEAAAQRCEKNLNVRDAGFDSRMRQDLYALQRLIEQYTNGLNEIDPETCAPRPSQTAILETVAPHFGPIDPSVIAASIAAHKQLEPLVYIAPDAHQEALKTLMAHGADAELNSDEADRAIVAGPLAQERTQKAFADIRLESLMGPITDTVLGLAHRLGKVVSISYAVGDDMVSSLHAKELQMQIVGVCAVLVEHAFPKSKNKGSIARAGQISISAIKRDAKLYLEVRDNGRQIKNSSFSELENIDLNSSVDGGNQIILRLEPIKARSMTPPLVDTKPVSDASLAAPLSDDFESDLCVSSNSKDKNTLKINLQEIRA